MSRRVATAAAAVATASIAFVAPGGAAVPIDSTTFQEAVTVDGIQEHLVALQAIADANDGDRAAGTSGYDASVEYVAGRLTAAGYAVTIDPFLFDKWEELAPPTFERTSPDATTYVLDDEFATMEYSGSGDVTGPLVPTNDLVLPPAAAANSSSSGCEAADFPPPPSPTAVALTQRGTCDFAVKAANAEAAGYAAVVIFNEGTPGEQDRIDTLFGTLSSDPADLPVLGTSFAVGDELAALAAGGPVTVHVVVDAVTTLDVPSANVIADSGGRADRTVVVGAHLDSVPGGAGINDNGSGSAAILEIAEELAESGATPRNRVRFAFWGAEEAGLLGATDYVATRTARELREIALNLNFDMLGSPNWVPFVYDGDGGDTGTAGPNGSSRIEQVLLEGVAANGEVGVPTAFDGRSDYGPFIDVGIPAGGLFSGAEDSKTAEEAAEYGGTAGVAYDPCYHQACDDIDNISTEALDVLGDAAAHSVLTFAMTTSSVNGTARASNQAAGGGDHLGDSLRR